VELRNLRGFCTAASVSADTHASRETENTSQT
jgi:hypothetical protein